jgi:hypothetical protein
LEQQGLQEVPRGLGHFPLKIRYMKQIRHQKVRYNLNFYLTNALLAFFSANSLTSWHYLNILTDASLAFSVTALISRLIWVFNLRNRILYLTNNFLPFFSKNELIIEEKSNFHARSQWILSMVKSFKQSCPIIESNSPSLTYVNILKVQSPEATNGGKPTKIYSAMVILENTPVSSSSRISWSNFFGLQYNLKLTQYVRLRKMISSLRSFEIKTSFELEAGAKWPCWPPSDRHYGGESLRVAQLVKLFPAFYGTWRLIIVLLQLKLCLQSYCVTECCDCIVNTPTSYLGGAGFKSQRLAILTGGWGSRVFLSPFKQIWG